MPSASMPTTVPPEPGESAASAYYAAWLDALEALLAERGLLP